MKKIVLIVSVVMLFAASANAGFWSSALGTAVGSSGSSSINYYGKDETKTPKQIQQTLSKLGFYSSKIDGNLNSFDTRSAIEEFQAYYGLKDTGILSEANKQDLLYMHDLLKNYKLELKNPKTKDSKRLKKLYKAFDKLENKLSNNKLSKEYMSVKFKKEIKSRRVAIAKAKKEKAIRDAKAKKEKAIRDAKAKKEKAVAYDKAVKWKTSYANFSVYADIDTKLVWQDDINAKSQRIAWRNYEGHHKADKFPADEYCRDLSLAGDTDWRLPTMSELLDLYKKRSKLKNISSSLYWTGQSAGISDGYAKYISFKSGNGGHSDDNNKFNVRCVRDGQRDPFESASAKREKVLRIDRDKKEKAIADAQALKKWEKENLNFPVYADYETKLIWQDDVSVIKLKQTWITRANYEAGNLMDTSGDTANTYCQKLSLAGYTDWRLPTEDELVNLSEKASKLKYISSDDYYWSSTSDKYGYNEYDASIVFSNGATSTNNKLYYKFVRCVRDGQRNYIKGTSEKEIKEARDAEIKKQKEIKEARDAKIEKWNKRFLNLPVYADSEAELIWQDDVNVKTTKKLWITQDNYGAKNYMDTSGDTANTYCQKLSLAGYADWRLPTIDELQNIYKKKSKLNNYTSAYCWSSTTCESDKSNACYINFYDGQVSSYTKGNDLHVRCVRDGQ